LSVPAQRLSYNHHALSSYRRPETTAGFLDFIPRLWRALPIVLARWRRIRLPRKLDCEPAIGVLSNEWAATRALKKSGSLSALIKQSNNPGDRTQRERREITATAAKIADGHRETRDFLRLKKYLFTKAEFWNRGGPGYAREFEYRKNYALTGESRWARFLSAKRSFRNTLFRAR